MPTRSTAGTAEARGIEAGARESFTDWLEWHTATTPDAIQLGVQAAVGAWLDTNQYRLERMIKEEVANIVREIKPAS